ncbi:prolyl 3-hydroxylase 2 isoform X4 [Ornithorhynchus anatinus]|uniref:procollagen-proline 3-dioxygenase n=1 Tax=Ornithorhynchus anatinus TaxID=9258 RepID=F7DUP5_ORNAN|nr:prolyl 3-hydroxylase 2 isoform X4 [Ornithorhynchus anatinus]
MLERSGRLGARLVLLLLLLLSRLGGREGVVGDRSEGREPLQPFDRLYDSGVEAYYSGDYPRVVHLMERALTSYRRLRDGRLRCRLRCRAEVPLVPLVPPLPPETTPGPAEELRFFGAVLRRALCLRQCEQEELGGPPSRHRASDEVRTDFHRRVPYNYLQRAYIKLNQLEKAAEAAHTFFMANPEHMEMQQNIENYKTMAGVEMVHFIDREAKPHLENYSAGVKHYEAGNFELAIESFEKALKEYFTADMECRALCEGPQRFEEYEYLEYKASLYEAIADHYMQILVCEHECVRELATRPGRLSPIENYLPLHYDYLQFAYYQVDEYVKALECAKSYLLFHPDDEDVQDNVSYYESLLEEGLDPETIEPREDAAKFLKRHKLESEIIKSSAAGLGFLYTEPNYWTSYGGRQDENQVPSGVNSELAEVHGQSMERKTITNTERELKEGGPLLFSDVKFVYNSEQLNGTQRVLLDNVLSEEECRELHSVASGIMLVGDGYRGRTSPHTPNEKFEGATVLKALKFGYEGRVPLKSARLFYDISEKARKIVESYFMLNSTLYFSYTHMVCRTALTGQQDRRNDLSHPIHADNCLLDPEANECWKEPPAYTFRDYSALLYMNGDFEGGEFIFTEMDAKTVTASIKPKCGRMISFSSGGENPHGVKAVTKGQRCAVALWFTLDPLYRELERLQADEVIATLDQEHLGSLELNINPKDEL